jgi:hypothetical protein
VTLDLLDDVFLLHLPLETAERALDGFSVVDDYFGQVPFTSFGTIGSLHHTPDAALRAARAPF